MKTPKWAPSAALWPSVRAALSGAALDHLIIALCISIGNAVAWLLALYTTRGVRLLLWDVLFGMTGAAMCAFILVSVTPELALVGLVVAGPLCALLMIYAGDAIRRAL